MNRRDIFKYHFLLIASVVFVSCRQQEKKYETWEVYNGSKESIHYSSIRQIDTSNVSQLQVAWTYHTGDADEESQIQANPLIVDNILYGISPKLRLFALDAATGKEKWVFNPFDTVTNGNAKNARIQVNACRGVAYYSDGKDDKRIFYSIGSQLHAIDANTGKRISSFGSDGKIDLHNDLGRDVQNLYLVSTTPGIIYKDMIIIGMRVSEDADAAPGHIRAYDVHTGKLRWIFHTIPYPGEAGYETWEDKEAYKHIGGANVWSGFSLDEEKGIVFAAIGSASYDFYGGKRLGQDLFANSIIALDAATGKRKWHYQTVHHDLWDRDPPTAPSLVTINKDGKKIEAVAQTTKTGFVFVLDRETGKPVFPVEERPVPTNTELQGEKANPTQPYPVLPEPFVRQILEEKDLNTLVSDSSYVHIKKRLQGYKTGNLFNPPSKQGTVIFPGFDGGAEWGGPSFDPETGMLYINASEMPWVLTMVDVKKENGPGQTNLQAGQQLYITHCMGCHGTDRKGGGNYPTLLNVNKKYNETQFMQLISSGRRMMPAFKQLEETEKEALASFILDIKSIQQKKFIAPAKAINPYLELPYNSTGYNKFVTDEGYPAVAPPWGSLVAIDLNTGKIAWKDTLGDYPELKAKGIHSGTENYGGSVVTAGGLIFIAATKDSKFRVFNKRTGAMLLETDLPAPGFATPAVYHVNGKQYAVIACGGGKLGTKSGDAYVAFAIPDK